MMRKYVPLQSTQLATSFKASRPSFPYVWSESAPEQFAAVDPDLDTTHFLFIADRYQSLGWQSGEVEPEQWQNFLQQISDLKVKECLQSGLFNWFADVTYLKGSLCFYNGSLYLSLSANNLGNQPDTPDSLLWELVYTLSGNLYQQTMSELSAEVNSHLVAPNPHQDDVTTIGGYTQDQIDQMFSVNNPETMAHHIADKNNPHELNCDQLEILPKEGGVFSGTVKFSGGISIGAGFIGWI